jgi:hypothetical protein
VITFGKQSIDKRFQAMRFEGYKWRPAWREIRDYIAPTHGFFEYEMPNWGKRIDHERIVNGHAMEALNTLASGMTSGLTSKSRPWFALGPEDPDLAEFQPVKEWCADVQRRMYGVYAKSNIYQCFTNLYSEVGGFGTGAYMLLSDYYTVIRGINFTIGEYYLAVDKVGRVNAFARQYWMTVAQLVEEFGIDNVSPSTQAMYKNGNIDKYRLVRHVIEPNDDRIEGREDFQGKEFRSVYWEQAGSGNTVLRLAGFDSFPVMGPRWEIRSTSDVWGRGPGWRALGDVKMLQKMEKDGLLALDKVVDPPIQVMGEVDKPQLYPGGITYSSQVVPGAGIKPAYQIQPDFVALQAWVDKVIARIDRAFYADLFMLISNDDRSGITAHEIVERHEEKLQMLGPVLESLESELLNPTIDRTFEIMLRAGLIPPPPPELQGTDLKVEYISILAQAQKMIGTTAIEQTLKFAGSLMASNPEAGDLINFDESIRQYADITGIPPEIVRSKDDVSKVRMARQKAAQAQMAAQAAERMAAGAKVLSETELGKNTALDAIMSNTGQPQMGQPAGQ